MEVSKGKTIQITLLLGIAVFIASFFLPALFADTPSPYLGWQCAVIAFRLWKSRLIFSALINPLVLAYVVLWWVDRFPKFQTYLAMAILVCISITWFVLHGAKMGIAHAMWITGVLLIIAPELARWKLSLQLEK
jgi:hypothetical protein